MNEKTKRILIRRKIREVITVKQNEQITFICEHCGAEHSFNLAEHIVAKEMNDGEKSNEISKSNTVSN